MKIPLTQVISPETLYSGCELFILREDERGLYEGGNKYFKLKKNLSAAKEQGFDTILSFGGVYSNHIAALAAAGKRKGLKTIGVIRGDEGIQTPTLKKAENDGMKLHYVSREEYRKKDSQESIAQLKKKFGNIFIVPEGGSNGLGIEGCKDIIKDVDIDFDIIAVPAGTGATATGIYLSLPEDKNLLVFQILKGEGYIEKNIKNYLDIDELPGRISVSEAFHFNGYAKTTTELLQFIRDFKEKFNIPLDHVYTGKMMFGILDMMRRGELKGKRIVAVHTGGLQGSRY